MGGRGGYRERRGRQREGEIETEGDRERQTGTEREEPEIVLFIAHAAEGFCGKTRGADCGKTERIPQEERETERECWTWCLRFRALAERLALVEQSEKTLSCIPDMLLPGEEVKHLGFVS